MKEELNNASHLKKNLLWQR